LIQSCVRLLTESKGFLRNSDSDEVQPEADELQLNNILTMLVPVEYAHPEASHLIFPINNRH
jgi:hypothetical protein